ncbi:MAG: hypothetical protein KatS3mg099_219 [Candidatus Parcubacteria bacterium]|nr:MAG: hypothetical protein KatS3mg099_219 [Candidatus Parcubacteria bacterium]
MRLPYRTLSKKPMARTFLSRSTLLIVFVVVWPVVGRGWYYWAKDGVSYFCIKVDQSSQVLFEVLLCFLNLFEGVLVLTLFHRVGRQGIYVLLYRGL